MAEAVEEALAAGDHLLVEAGTGIGKTLAYLVPAARLGERVVISTGTRNLQDQIFFKDLPQLARLLDLQVRAAYLKGRDNYLCLHRHREFRRAPTFPSLQEARAFQAVDRWAAVTHRGDRSEVPDLPEGVGFWRRINARAEACLGRRCPDYEDCFLVRMRREAAEADLVVVNHHLLLADLAVKAGDFGTILPDYRHVILDEAHLLEDVATGYFGRRLSSARCHDLAEDAGRFLREAGMAAGPEARAAEAVEVHAGLLFDALAAPDGGRRRLAPGEMPAAALEARDQLLTALQELAASLEAREEPGEDLEAAARRAREAAADLQFITGGDDPEHARWVEQRGRGAAVHAAPIDVSRALREHLFDRVASAVLTSATLTVGGDFDFLRRRLGLAGGREMEVPSPFDYSRQAVLYLPEALPPPEHPAYPAAAEREIRDLLEISGGRAFLLFTSYAALHRMHDRLRAGGHDFALMAQGEGARHALLERFRVTPRAVLLATASFWQGVDVPGAALSLVVIDRLPFDVPTDPLVAARADRLRRGGDDPFRAYQLPAAVIGLKQGAGRLIRSREDRGVLAILDARIRTRWYGRAFLESLPRFRRTSDLEEVRRFVARPG